MRRVGGIKFGGGGEKKNCPASCEDWPIAEQRYLLLQAPI